MQLSKKKIIKISIAIGMVFIMILMIFFLFRQNILDNSIEKIKGKLNQKYYCELQIKNAHFEGISGLELEEIILIPKQKDTLIKIKRLQTKISLFKLLTGKIQLNELHLEGGFLQGVKNQKGKNFDSFLKNKKVKNQEYLNSKPNYGQKIYQLLDVLLLLIPTDLHIKQFAIIIKDLDNQVSLNIQDITLDHKDLNGRLEIISEKEKQPVLISGTLDPRKNTASIELEHQNKKNISIPYIFKRFGMISNFQKLHINLNELDLKKGIMYVKTSGEIQKFMVNQPKIASKNVFINKASFDFQTSIGEDFIQIDHNSYIQMNELKINLSARFENKDEKNYSFQLKIPTIEAQTFIESLPAGLFSNFEGMKASGSLAYQLDFKYNPSDPKALVFEPKVTTHQLKIQSFGKANLSKINNEFSYQAIEKGVRQRAIWVGSENPYFTPLNQISKLLESSVLTSEDPSFYQHSGFIQDAFKQSIQKNFEENKFVRGGSTISMQLVKNVFLTREKTISRKIEEIMLVYLLEKKRIAPKNRMLEVYFNVIEWGPNVYGIGEASQFYFNKTPLALNLKECLFLASIVPRPKKFMYFFDSDGNLKKFSETKNNFIKNLMLKRGLIQAQDTIGYEKPLILSSEARSFIRIKPDLTSESEDLIENLED